MSVYPRSIAKIIEKPSSARRPHYPNGVGTGAKFDCGCFLRMFLEMDEVTGQISEVGYETNGCGYILASAEWIAETLRGELLTDLHGFVSDDRIAVCEGLTDEVGRVKCIEAAFEAVRGAFRDHRSRRLERADGEVALICTCFGVSEETIERFVKESQAKSLEDVVTATRAGSGCGSCRMLIMEIIDSESE